MAVSNSIFKSREELEDAYELARKRNQYLHATANTVGGAAISGIMNGRLAPNSVTSSQPTITSAMLKSDVFSLPVDSLCDVWLARFGDAWVDTDTLENDDFWRNTYARLKTLGKIETHYLTDRQKYVCRKPA